MNPPGKAADEPGSAIPGRDRLRVLAAAALLAVVAVLAALVAARGSAGQAGEAVAFAREARDLAESPELRVRLDAFIRNGGTVPP